ncbi:probable cytochrome P450 313a4 [Drosophila hydei]|uniref:Probable cytochrome P450 313a4 n=1 Tax=Drosophila hydei TaxID=7224 RepID=A0A6J2SS13_DROHY|nr:probable cytochrome P450 313a4 [Drosophila hydei]
MDLILCIILVALLVLYYLWTRREFYKLSMKFPGPLGYPLIGIALKLSHNGVVLKLLRTYIKKYGNIFVSWLGPFPALIVSDPQVTRDILTSPNCVNKSFFYKIIEDSLGKGLITLHDSDWTKHRKILNPAFSHKMLLSFFPIFNKETGILLKEFNKLADGEERDILPCLQLFTLSIATQTTMGTCVKEDPKFQDNSIVVHFQWLIECATEIMHSPWLYNPIIRQMLGKEEQFVKSKTYASTFITKIVDQKLSEDIKDETPCNNNSVLNLAIHQFKRGTFARKDVEDESCVLVAAAVETSSNAVAFTLMLLAMFPEYQEKAFGEIQALFPKAGDFSISYEDIQQMVYLDLVVNECLRLIPPVPIVARQTSQPVRLSSGVVIPKGMQIIINIFEMQRRKDIWGEEAESFNPDHFLPHNFQDIHPYGFIPFTKGIRNCIGWRYGLLSIKLTLAKLLRNYKFSTSFNFKNLEYVENVTMKLATMPLLKFEQRN